jgi:hypothetical protein
VRIAHEPQMYRIWAEDNIRAAAMLR